MRLRLSLSGERLTPKVAESFDGVGLVRGEYPMRLAQEYITLPQAQAQIANYLEAVCSSTHPHDVWYRTSDLWSDEASTLAGIDLVLNEDNPLTGLRGGRRALRLDQAFRQEVEVVAAVAERKRNLHLLLPFVGDANEFATLSTFAREAGWPSRIGTMLEIPSAVLDVNGLIEAGADYLLFGLNDLTCLLRGASRASGFDDKLHPSVWWCVDSVARAARHQPVEWGIAGTLAPEVLDAAREHDVPFASVHYSDLPAALGWNADDLPDLQVVRQTKVRTREAIAAYRAAQLRLEAAPSASSPEIGRSARGGSSPGHLTT